ncbi:hypothetical protein D3C85_1257070 [compost metagenome]
MAIPGIARRLALPQLLLQVVQHPQVVEGVSVAGDHVDYLAHPGPLLGGGGHQGVGRIGLVEVLHDGHRLTQLHIPVDEKRHQPLGIDPAIGLLFLLTLSQIDRVLLITKSLELQHQTHAKAGR